jgi:flagellar biosynthesis/type III secretory pathway chaperone
VVVTTFWDSAMNKDLDFLYNSLLLSMGQECEHYEELLKAIKEETHVLKKSNLPDILEFNTRKERLLLSLNMASEMRMSAVKKIVSHLNLDEPVSMTQLIAYAQDHTRQNLTDYQEKFADMIAKIKKMNDHNKTLITFLLSHIGNTLNYINSITSSCPNYDQCGQVKARNLQGRLISQEG